MIEVETEPLIQASEDQPLKRADAEMDAMMERLRAARSQIGRAVAERQSDREREALLIDELRHRVRNVLAVVRSIFSRTMETGTSLESVADHFRGRLDALARYQVSRAVDPGGRLDLENLVRTELQDFRFGDDARISIEGSEIGIDHNTVESLGLALHELVTNSIKFGALGSDRARARLSIAWRVEERQIVFEWRETGIAVLSAAPPHRGFGREFIEDAIPYQIGAETVFDLRPGGLFCRIALPLTSEE